MSTQFALPSSLSPHVCVFPSDDLVDFLASSNLPPLHHLLQCFSSLPQVNTRTTSLTSITHDSFEVRFSDLGQIEDACREDPETRASRFLDWIGGRVAKHASSWVEEVESNPKVIAPSKLPWWRDATQCVEGDRTPNRLESWNHPVAVIFAVSTSSRNPLQAIQNLLARSLDFPPWVDSHILRYSLIIHSRTGYFSDEESIALFNAVKKQHGHLTYLLNIDLTPNANPLSLIPSPPLLPPQDASSSKAMPQLPLSESLALSQQDITEVSKFVRELVVMTIVPWMERCILDWNDTYTAARRLPSRLFSSTRRLFGASGPSNYVNSSAQSFSPKSTQSFSPTSSTSFPTNDLGHYLFPHRRLAEFATILGDLKIAVPLWESLRKEGLGGSEILPLLLASSSTISAHALYALQSLKLHQSSPSSQLAAFFYATRWVKGVTDFTSRDVIGEQWLVAAASSAEEVYAALLVGQAASLRESECQHSRTAALWYVMAADRLEKCGIKPLTMYFLRKASRLYQLEHPKAFSPSFLEAEFFGSKSQADFTAVLSHIEHSLARLHYTTGNLEEAVRMLLKVIRPESNAESRWSVSSPTALHLEDFRSAFEHLASTSLQPSMQLSPEVRFCSPARIRIALNESYDIDMSDRSGSNHTWEDFSFIGVEEDVKISRNAEVEEKFWARLPLQNPLDVTITLANVTLRFDESDGSVFTAEIIDKITLEPYAEQVVAIGIIAHGPTLCVIREMTYDFLTLLPCSESLAISGKRLNDTPAQTSGVVYGPNTYPQILVEDGQLRLTAEIIINNELSPLILGECRKITLKLTNSGIEDIRKLWLVWTDQDALWIDSDSRAPELRVFEQSSIVRLVNSSKVPRPVEVILPDGTDSRKLGRGLSFQIPLTFQCETSGTHCLKIWLLYQNEVERIRGTLLQHFITVTQDIQVLALIEPAQVPDIKFDLTVEIQSAINCQAIKVVQISTLSPMWKACTINESSRSSCILLSEQSLRFCSVCDFWPEGGGRDTTNAFIESAVNHVLNGSEPGCTAPPLLDLIHSRHHKAEMRTPDASMNHLIFTRWRCKKRQQRVAEQLLTNNNKEFPLVDPREVDVIIIWEGIQNERQGFIILTGLALGAAHEILQHVLSELETSPKGIYAETHNEKRLTATTIGSSIWNANVDPLEVFFQIETSIERDFRSGPMKIPLIIYLKNYSPFESAMFTMQLIDESSGNPPRSLTPLFSGHLKKRGEVGPLQTHTWRTNLWIARPGKYCIAGWKLVVQVGCQKDGSWQTRHVFVQTSDQRPVRYLTVKGRP